MNADHGGYRASTGYDRNGKGPASYAYAEALAGAGYHAKSFGRGRRCGKQTTCVLQKRYIVAGVGGATRNGSVRPGGEKTTCIL